MSKHFGTDGCRGKAGATLTVADAYKIGEFIGFYTCGKRRHFGLTPSARIVIGRDTRRSGIMFECALCSSLNATGADAYLLGVTTTPAVSYITHAGGFDCGIMISASHNPYYDNGIKLFAENGEKLGEEVISLIEDYMCGKPVFGYSRLPYAVCGDIGRTADYAFGRTLYKDWLVSLAGCSFGGIKVGLDLANGSACTAAKDVFRALGATVYAVNDSPDGININLRCGSTHPEGLCKAVRERELNVGFAYDGDADRCICSDENGNAVNGDKMLYIFAEHLIHAGKLPRRKVVATKMSNLGLFKALEKAGIECEVTDVGDRFVKERMSSVGAALGGEQSGHIIFSDYAPSGDGILTSLMIMRAMIAEAKPLSALASPVEDFPQTLINVRVGDRDKAVKSEALRSAVRRAEEDLKGGGRVVVRPSGTEPVVRVMVEAESAERCKCLASAIAAAIRNF